MLNKMNKTPVMGTYFDYDCVITKFDANGFLLCNAADNKGENITSVSEVVFMYCLMDVLHY